MNTKTGWDNSLNTKSISSNLASFEAARSSFFVFSVAKSDLENLVDPNYTGDDPTGHYLDTDFVDQAIRLNVTKCPVPSFNVETGEFRRGNDVVKFVTVPKFEGGTIEIDDVVGLDTKSVLLAWLYLAYNPNTRKVGRMTDYKKTCTLMEYTQDYELIRTWTLEGCFIKKVGESEFDREQTDKRKLSIELEYDRATVKRDMDRIMLN